MLRWVVKGVNLFNIEILDFELLHAIMATDFSVLNPTVPCSVVVLWLPPLSVLEEEPCQFSAGVGKQLPDG